MDDSALIATLEAVLQNPDVSRRNRLFLDDCLPDLRNGMLKSTDREDLIAIARDFAHNHPHAASAMIGEFISVPEAFHHGPFKKAY